MNGLSTTTIKNNRQLQRISRYRCRNRRDRREVFSSAVAKTRMATVNINSPYTRIRYPRFITRESSRRGRFTMGRQIAARLYDGDVIANSAMWTNKCEIRCIHNAKGWARGPFPGARAPAL